MYPSSLEGHLGCGHLSAVVDGAAGSVGVQTSVQVPAFDSSAVCLEVGLMVTW